MRTWHRWVVLGVAAASLGCGWLEDRFKTCRDIRVRIENSEQTLEGVRIAGPGEAFTDDTFLESGDVREKIVCAERGERTEFRALHNGRVVGEVKCVLSRHPEETTTVRVIWTLQGFQCQGW